jgi:glycosyltransferase involved in cell wall biosynthesis
MKVLLGCLNVNGLGGSELYHYELARQLSFLGIDITLFSLRPIDPNNEVRKNLNRLNIRQLDLNTLNLQESFDIIVASQPEVNNFFLQYLPNTPLISIIHSEIRSEDPVLDPRIKHYIAIRQPIQDMLINHYNIPSNKISLIYNPIDQTRFNTDNINPTEKITGIFVGEVLDTIRFKPISHLANQCIENDWDLWIVSKSRYNFNHPNIKYFDPRWDIETLVKQ